MRPMSRAKSPDWPNDSPDGMAGRFGKREGLVCNFRSSHDNLQLPSGVPLVVYRFAQEALTNVAKHSGATLVEIEFHRNEEEIVISIIDNGRGISQDHSVSPHSYGMLGMRERVDQLDGQISFDTPPGGGFSVTVSLPLPAKASEEEEA